MSGPSVRHKKNFIYVPYNVSVQGTGGLNGTHQQVLANEDV